MRRSLFFAALFLSWPVGEVRGQIGADALLEVLPPGATIHFDTLRIESGGEGQGTGGSLLGNARLVTADYELHADAIGVAALERVDGEERPPYRLVALGNILLIRGRQSFRAESLIFESRTRRALLTQVRLRTDIEYLIRARAFYSRRRRNARVDGRSPALPPESPTDPRSRLVLAARVLETDGFERFAGEGIQLTTCDFGIPHSALTAGRATVSQKPPKEPQPGAEEELPSYYVDLDDVGFQAGETPVLVLPPLSFDTRWIQSIPLRSVSYSNSSGFGNRVNTLWDGNLLLPRSLRKFVDLGLRLEYLSDRGTGYGADIQYGTRPHRWAKEPGSWADHYGEGLFYAIDDRGTDRTNGLEPEHEERNRVRFHHRTRFPWGTYVDLEYAVERDSNFLNEYYESEVRGEKAPENIIYFRHPFGDDIAATLLLKKRMVPYREVVERLPEVTVHVMEKPLGDSGFDFDMTARGSALHFLPANTDPVNSASQVRGDLRSALAYALGRTHAVPWVKIRPFIETRFTAYEKDEIRNNSIERLALGTGARMSTQFWKNFDAGGLFGLNRIRHVINPEIRYRTVFENNVDPVELFTYDEIDTVDRFEQITFSLSNYLLGGSTPQKGAEEVRRRLVEADLSIDYFPDPTRDNLGDPWGPVEGEILLSPYRWLGFDADGEYDVESGTGFQDFNAGVTITGDDGSRLRVGNRYREHVSHSLTASARWQASEKYEFEVYYEFDFRRNEAVNQELRLIRNFHRWACIFEIDVDEGENDDVTISVNFGPRELLSSLQYDGDERGRRQER